MGTARSQRRREAVRSVAFHHDEPPCTASHACREVAEREANLTRVPPAKEGRSHRRDDERGRDWVVRLTLARARCREFLEDRGNVAQLAEGAPTLVDSRYAPELRRALARVDDDIVLTHPRLAFAAGRLAALELRSDRATRFLIAATTPGLTDIALVARAFWELGCLHLRDLRPEAAEITLALARGALGEAVESCADLIHLEALIADARGDIDRARLDYRRAISTAGALSQLTRVTALRNLAAALTHSEPHEAVGLCEFALTMIEADRLDDRARPTINNVYAYALLCSGDVEAGAARAQTAFAEATRFKHELVAQYARFNQAIAYELKDQGDAALRVLDELLARTDKRGELHGWVQIRRAWLATKAGNVELAHDLLGDVEREHRSHVYDEALATLRALIVFQRRELAAAASAFGSLAEGYAARGDQLTAFVLLLWRARASTQAGDARVAQSALRRAGRLGSAHGFRLAPNWWASDLTELDQESTDPETAGLLSRLLSVSGKLKTPTDLEVRVGTDGSVVVRGREMAADRWRVGKTGSRVLRKAFRLLATARTAGLSRDELTDSLWPDADGDRAVANLYACLNDLRHLLAEVPGLRLAYTDRRYRLMADPFVKFASVDPRHSAQH